MDGQYFLAIDVGTTEAKHVVGWLDGGKLKTDVVYTFRNYEVRHREDITWNLGALKDGLLYGIRAAFKKYPYITSLAIDAWGCDYVLMDGDEVIYPSYSYLHYRTKAAVSEVHKKVMPFGNIYMTTGVAFRPYNTLYQLYEDNVTGRLRNATDFLMMPEYLTYLLTGEKMHEYTIATTTGMIDMKDKDYDGYLLAKAGFPGRFFKMPVRPGTKAGRLLPGVEEFVGGNCDVILCASHNTASAVYGLDVPEGGPFLMADEWAKLGCKKTWGSANYSSMYAGFSNEGGADGINFVRNTMGLWVVHELIRNFPKLTVEKAEKFARESDYDGLVDADDQKIRSSFNMKRTFDEHLKDNPPKTVGDYFRCAYMSLVRIYDRALSSLIASSCGMPSRLYVTGEGAKSDFLCDLIEEKCRVKVVRVDGDLAAEGNLRFQINQKYGRHTAIWG